MYFLENPVLQRELLVNLRMPRSFWLLLLYQVILGVIVYFAWPRQVRLDLTEGSGSNSQLVDLVFLGQYVLASLMAPSFAAGAVSGEKERKTYEMLLASPINPESIVIGKLIAALTHLAMLIVASLPIVMLCLPLGGVSFYEVLAAYVMLIASVVAFGMISVACGSFFPRTSSSLVVSYLVILPLALLGVLFWVSFREYGEIRFQLAMTVVPGIAIAISTILFYMISARMIYPKDMGSDGTDVVDLENENETAVGLVLSRDKFPDRLFAPPIRNTLMPDGVNPIYDKELRSEIFGQGTLMLRLAIQISMVLAMFLMGWLLFIQQHLAAWYFCFVVLFNVLVGPVFSAGSVTSERERQTLDLLLTTLITPWQILSGKLISGLRVSSVLTLFLLWPVFLAVCLSPGFRANLLPMLCYFIVFCLTCLTTANLALFCSTRCQKTSTSLIATYAIILILYLVPPAVAVFANQYYGSSVDQEMAQAMTITSPFAANLLIPLEIDSLTNLSAGFSEQWSTFDIRKYWHFGAYVLFTLGLNGVLLGVMVWMFNSRWRVAKVVGDADREGGGVAVDAN
ncbi:ABC transporter permease subunit [bacterium]|nr:ABC transporter permease subunit [bacterium]